ncbi:MAG: glutathione ABC transporter permease GsiC, partial [Microthrixaceae bacterium]
MRMRPARIARFLGVRLLSSAIVLLGVMIVVFALIQLVPGDPVRL